MLYTHQNKPFKQHVHNTLKRRIKTFMVLAAIMLAIVIVDIAMGSLNIGWALFSIAIGAVIGFVSTRIFHLSWNKDGEQVVARVDKIGWIVLVAYIVFEIVRSSLFMKWLPDSATAITFAFVASALISRVFGLRGRIIRILQKEGIFS